MVRVSVLDTWTLLFLTGIFVGNSFLFSIFNAIFRDAGVCWLLLDPVLLHLGFTFLLLVDYRLEASVCDGFRGEIFLIAILHLETNRSWKEL